MHYDPVHAPGSVARSRSWAGRGSVRSASPGSAMSGASRYDMNQNMRERAAEMWLQQIRQTHEKRRVALQRNQEIEDMKKQQVVSKLDNDNLRFSRNRSQHDDYLKSRSHAFQERANYLREAKEHSLTMQQIKEEQIEQEAVYRQQKADETHKQMVSARARETFLKNKERAEHTKRNHSLITRRRESVGKAKIGMKDLKQQRIQEQKMKEEEQRLAMAEEKEMQRREALSRNETINEYKRASVEAKLRYDGQRSSSVLRKREEWLKEKQRATQLKQQRIEQQVAHANMMRSAKEQQFDAHYRESIAIGTETAEHNKIFKLNNKIMHEVMQGMIHDAKSHRSRSSSTYRR
eukprot:TRINITY_DN48006_c0_g1_i1.p1 TRINITY_DN48006_c0_g1~~TRINITY_DN48006_c0_g1_i1.p1  ORF type:complete len:349 (+),score=117.26 TRINITY_DN48006_c0_g1_i1:69-1115(+)